MSNKNIGNIDNSNNIDKTTDIKDIASIKYEKMTDALNKMEIGSADYLHGQKIFSEIEKGNIPLESRPFSSRTEFIKENPEFKFSKEEINAITNFSSESNNFLLGKDFGSFMGTTTTTPHYIYDKDKDGNTIKDENNKATKTDFKNDLKDYFTSENYNNIDKIYVNQDFSRSYMYKGRDLNIGKVAGDDYKTSSSFSKEDFDNIYVKDYKNLQLTTFEIHKTDGDIEYKSYFTNSSGDILATYDTGDDNFPMFLSEGGKCEALNTAKDNIVYRNPNNDVETKLTEDKIDTPYDLLKNESYIAMGKSSDIQIEKISTQNSNLKLDEIVGKITSQIDFAKSFMNCLYIEKNVSMGEISETYKKVDDAAKKIASNVNQMFRLDRSSEEYITLKKDNDELKKEYKEATIEFGKIYSKTDLFNDNEIKEIRAYIGEKEGNIDVIKERVEILKDLPDGNKEKFNAIINKEFPHTTNTHTISKETISNIEQGFKKAENAVNEWNEKNPDNPISIDYDNYALYDKHGIEIHSSNEGYEKKFNADYVKDGATTPKDKNGEVTKESIESFTDNKIYDEFVEQFDTETITSEEIDNLFNLDDPVDLIRHYTEEKALSEDYDSLNKDIKDEIGINDNKKIDDSSISDSLSNDSRSRVNIKSSSNHIDYTGVVKLSDEKIEKIKAECRKELKGYITNSDAYDTAYKKLYSEKVTKAEANLSKIVDKIKNSDVDISKMRNYLGNYFSRTNLTLSTEIIGIDSKIAAYEKAGGYIGTDSFIKDSPSFVEKFGNVVSFLNGNIFLTIITNVIYIASDSIEKNKENNVEKDKNDTATNERNENQNDISNDSDTKDNNTANDVENKQTDEATQDVANEQPEEAAKDLENEQTDETAKDLENEQTDDTAEDLENKQTDETAEDLENEQTDDTAKDLEDEESDETAEDLENEQTDDTAEDLENEQTDETAKDLENEQTDDTAEDLEDEESDETAEDLENEQTDDTAEDLENEEPDETAEDLENEQTDDTAENLENEESDETAEDLENEQTDDTAEDLEDEESDETAYESEYDTSSDEKNDDAAFIEDSQEQIEDEDNDDNTTNGDNEDNTTKEDNNKEESIVDKVKDKIKETVSDYLREYNDFKETYSEILDCFDLISNPEQAVVDIIEGIVDAVSDYINNKEITNADGDTVSIQEKLSDTAETIVEVADVCSDITEMPADDIRNSIIEGLNGNIPDGMIANIEYQADEFKANEMYDNIENQSYGDTDFNDYENLSSEVDLQSIELQIEKNPIGVDNNELKNEIDTSLQIDNLSNDYIEQGLGYEDAYVMAETGIAPNDDIDVNQNENYMDNEPNNDFSQDNYDGFAYDIDYDKQNNLDIPQENDIGTDKIEAMSEKIDDIGELVDKLEDVAAFL